MNTDKDILNSILAKNKLNNDHMTKILDCYADRAIHEHFSRLVSHQEIAEKNYNISVSTYVEPRDDREVIREVIDITELNTRIKGIVSRQHELRTQIDAIVADLEGG